MPSKKSTLYLYSLLAGVLMTLSFPYTGSLTPLVFISWIPLLLIEHRIRIARYRSINVFIHAYLAFLTFNLGSTWWIWNASPVGALMAITLNAFLMALAFQCFHLLTKALGSKYAIVSLLSVWISFEYFHHQWELSWPWLSLGNFFSIRTTWIQWYSYTGVLGGTLWILIINYLGYKSMISYFRQKTVCKQTKKWLTGLALCILIPIIFSLFAYYNYMIKKESVEVVLVQPNIDPYTEKFIAPINQQVQEIINQASKKISKRTRLVIAPETALSSPFIENEFITYPFYRYLKQKLREWKHTALYTGASTARYFPKKNSRASMKLTDAPGYIEQYNSSLIMEPDGTHSFLHKSKLVLGVEKIPFSDWFPFLEKLSIENGGTSGTLGIENEPKTIQTGTLTFAPLICYESVYGDFCAEQCRKGAQMICIITNDGWWGDTPGYKQHMSFARLRAIENRRDVARSANTGISCFIDQRGDVKKATKWWEATALRSEMHLNAAGTFYSNSGDILGRLFLTVLICISGYTLFYWFKKTFLYVKTIRKT
jgi:apolipoprotein N-acyltransferase